MCAEQIRIERLVHDVSIGVEELMKARLSPDTAHLVLPEEANLFSAMTGLQVLLSNILADRPKLRVVG